MNMEDFISQFQAPESSIKYNEEQCIDILKRDDIKQEMKVLSKPIIEFILYEINPYIYITFTFVISIFIMNFAILILLFYLYMNKDFFLK